MPSTETLVVEMLPEFDVDIISTGWFSVVSVILSIWAVAVCQKLLSLGHNQYAKTIRDII